MRRLLLTVLSFSFGMLSSAGVFTALSAVSLVPRFAGRLRIAKYVYLIEEVVIFGGILGGILSVYADGLKQAANYWYQTLAGHVMLLNTCRLLAGSFLVLFGVFTGIFVGCLAFAIAEMLDSIPIFSRRISLEKGLVPVITAAAFGKLLGSLFYFIFQIS